MADDISGAERVKELEERIGYLEEVLHRQIARIYAIEQRLGSDNRLTEEASAVAGPPGQQAGHRVVVPSRSAGASATPAPPPVRPEAASRPASGKAAAPAGRAKAAAAGVDWEAIVAGNWFSRVGVVAIVLAVGFFLRYAIENDWIGPLGRVLLGLLAGTALLGGGEWLRDRGYRFYAHGLTGGGISSLYLSFYAAFAVYGIVSQTTAFGFMSLVTIGAVLLASRYNALSIAILGLIGGFLTPVMLSTGRDNQAALFGYMILLDLGVLGIAWFRHWRVLHYLAWGATVLLGAAWWVSWYEPAKLRPTLIFVTVLFLIFSIAPVLYNLVRQEPVRELDVLLVLGNGALYFRLVWQLLQEDHHAWLGAFAMLLAGYYAAKAWWVHRREHPDRYLVMTFAGMATLCLTLAVPMQFDQHWVTMGWAIEGALLTLIGMRLHRRLTRTAAMVVFGIAIVHWFAVDLGDFTWREGAATFLPLFNRRGASIFVLIATLAGSAYAYRANQSRLSDVDDGERRFQMGAMALAAWLLIIYWLSVDGRDFCNQLAERDDSQSLRISLIWSWFYLYLAVLWSLAGTLTLAVALRRRMAGLRFVAFGLWLIAIVHVTFNVTSYQTQERFLPLINPTFGAFLALAAALAAGYREYSRSDRPESVVRSVCLSLANLFLLFGLSLEVDKLSLGTPGTRISFFAHQLLLSALYAVYGGTMMAIGIVRRNRLVRRLGLGLLVTTIVKVFFFDLSSLEQIYRVLSFIILGVTLLLVSFLYQRLRRRWEE